MLNVLSSIQLATALAGDTSSIIALVLGSVALVIALLAYSIARRGSSGQSNEPVMAVAAATSGVNAVASQPVSDDRQLVAVITAAIAAILADEASVAGAAGAVGNAGVAGVAGVAGAAGVIGAAGLTSVSGTTGVGAARTGSGPYAGFVVRRIRRV